jgi:hypothetical protein
VHRIGIKGERAENSAPTTASAPIRQGKSGLGLEAQQAAVKAVSRRSRSRAARAMVPCPLHRHAKASLLGVSSARNVRINVDFCVSREWTLTDEQRAQVKALTPSSDGRKSRPLHYPMQMVEGAIYGCAATRKGGLIGSG